ncbi:hypothetical protein CH063_06318 [Colletotrichum higginsianum]|uniref:Uncharacterized protein n=1 Tax=Colletotrichum higginsianum (strain IMI 349063) TaxID=759273 RepID=H1V238_COLHI|nr:hypothetical protein CH063_06318 [Colletotrichum higginsianum]
MKSYVVLVTLFASLALATPSVQSNAQDGELLARQLRPPVRPPGSCCGHTQCADSCCPGGCPAVPI